MQGVPPMLLERLGKDHARISGIVRELGVLSDTAMEEPDWQRLRELLGFLDYFADKVHHPLEDRLFDHLVNKGLSPTERHLVFRNLHQHQEIKALTETLQEQAVQGAQGATVDYPEFQETVADYLSLQRRHMQFEETQLFPLLNAEFDNHDWSVLMGILESSPVPDTAADRTA